MQIIGNGKINDVCWSAFHSVVLAQFEGTDLVAQWQTNPQYCDALHGKNYKIYLSLHTENVMFDWCVGKNRKRKLTVEYKLLLLWFIWSDAEMR